MIRRATLAVVSLLATFSAATLSACTLGDQAEHSSPAATNGTSPDDPAVLTEQDDVEASITIRSVGDILLHEDVYADAANRAGGNGYDFAPMVDPVRPYLQNADITTANMEVPVAGEELQLSGYPAFNAPPEIVDALAGAGVDIVNNATNHSMDRGLEGLQASISNMRERGMLYVGAYSSPDDRATPRVIERNGLKVGFLSYTYGTNGIPVPEGAEWSVNHIDPKLMQADITALRPDVDVLIVMMHAGEEYESFPVQYQIDTADTARNAGADFILGGHPHLIEPFQRYPDNEPGLGVWWSHGNFLHGQTAEGTKFGGIGEYTISRRKDGTLALDSIRFMPTYTVGMPHTAEYKVIPLADAKALPYVDPTASKAVIERMMNHYTDVEVVDYLD